MYFKTFLLEEFQLVTSDGQLKLLERSEHSVVMSIMGF